MSIDSTFHRCLTSEVSISSCSLACNESPEWFTQTVACSGLRPETHPGHFYSRTFFLSSANTWFRHKSYYAKINVCSLNSGCHHIIWNDHTFTAQKFVELFRSVLIAGICGLQFDSLGIFIKQAAGLVAVVIYYFTSCCQVFRH